MGRNRKKRKAKESRPIIVYTDGSADVKAGTSGYGYVIVDENGNIIEEGSGPLDVASNTYAELSALVTGLNATQKHKPTQLTVYTDYKTIPTVLKYEIDRWQKHGWKTSKGKDVQNRSLWQQIVSATRTGKVDIRWVKGHSGNEFNRRCDFLAWEAMRNATQNRKSKLPVS